MKRELLFLIGLNSAIYATQEISCVEFVQMSKGEAKSYIDNYRQEFELNHFKLKNHTDSDKAYIGMQSGISKHILNCLDLRRVTLYGVEDVRRALILSSLSQKSLTQEERSIYQKSLNENITHYAPYSNSSLLNVGYLPLVYLTIQKSKDNRNYIVYEFRQNGSKIKKYSKKIPIRKPTIQFTKNSSSNKSYLNYLNTNHINPKLGIFHIVQPLHQRVKQSTVVVQENIEKEYEVINSFQAIRLLDKVTYYITQKDYPIKTKEKEGKVYFILDDGEYYASKKWWRKSTRQIGGFE